MKTDARNEHFSTNVSPLIGTLLGASYEDGLTSCPQEVLHMSYPRFQFATLG
jgi:hypothetical protein